MTPINLSYLINCKVLQYCSEREHVDIQNTALSGWESNDPNHLYRLMSRTRSWLMEWRCPGHEKVCNPNLIDESCYEQLFGSFCLFIYLFFFEPICFHAAQSESCTNYAEARIMNPAATHRNGRNPPHSRLPLWLSRRGPGAGRSAETAQHRAVLLWAEI